MRWPENAEEGEGAARSISSDNRPDPLGNWHSATRAPCRGGSTSGIYAIPVTDRIAPTVSSTV